jgi:hypothetical protein
MEHKPRPPRMTPQEWVANQKWGPLTDEQTPEMIRLREIAEDATTGVMQRQWDAAHEAAQTTHPGFTITCQACGSEHVFVANNLSWSECSGLWGDVALVCADCGKRIAVFES